MKSDITIIDILNKIDGLEAAQQQTIKLISDMLK